MAFGNTSEEMHLEGAWLSLMENVLCEPSLQDRALLARRTWAHWPPRAALLREGCRLEPYVDGGGRTPPHDAIRRARATVAQQE